jgi:hypothetical protein
MGMRIRTASKNYTTILVYRFVSRSYVMCSEENRIKSIASLGIVCTTALWKLTGKLHFNIAHLNDSSCKPDTKLSLFADDAILPGRDYYPSFAMQKF